MSQFLIQTTIDTRERPASLLATSTFLDHALTASVDRTVRYINPLTYEEEYCGQGHSRGVTALAVSDCIQAQAPIICSSGRDGVLCLWGPRKAEVIRKVTPPCTEIKTLSIFQFATVCYIILGTKDGKVIIYDMATNSVLKTLLGHRSSVLCSSVVYRGKHLDGEPLVTRHIAIATGGKDRTVRVWDFDKGKRKRKLKHPKLITCLAVARESIKPVLISGCSNGLLYLWDISMGVILRTFEGHREKIYSVCLWETHEILVASCSGDCTIRVFDALSGECVTTMVGHKRPVKEIAMFTDYESGYSVLLSVGADRTWRVWDITSVLGTFFHPALPEDFEWPADSSDPGVPIGRNEVPADNPEFEYTTKDGEVKRGFTRPWVQDRDEEGQGEGGAGVDNDEDEDGEQFNDEDFELSDDEGGIMEEDGDVTGERWGMGRKRPAPVPSGHAEGSGPAEAAPACPGGGSVVQTDAGTTTVPSDTDQTMGLTVQTSAGSGTASGDVTPPPASSSQSIVGTPARSAALSAKEMLKHSEKLQDKFVSALAAVELDHAREKSRQATNLSQRLTMRRSQQQSTKAAAPGADNGEGGRAVSPTPPSSTMSTASLASPLRRGRISTGGEAEDDATAGAPAVDEVKDQLKKEHEIHTTRHRTRMSMQQNRASHRLALRLNAQAKKKFKQLSQTERQVLKAEGDGNSDDDYDGNGKLEEEDEEEDD